jgi:multidrug efflux pump
MSQKLQQFQEILLKDPAIEFVVGFTGGAQTNTGLVFMALKPLSERKISADQVIDRMRGELAQIPGATLFLQVVQDIRAGNAQYQYTLQADSSDDLFAWAPKVLAELQKVPQMTQVNTDQQNLGLEANLVIDRDTAARLGVTVAQIDNTLYDAFGQRQVSTIFNPRNQYHVVMEVAPKYWQNPEMLKNVYVSTSGGAASGTHVTNAVAGTVSGPATGGTSTAASATAVAADATRNQSLNSIGNTGRDSASTGAAVSTKAETMVPLSAISHFDSGNIPLAINHQGLAVSTTISFNLEPGASLSDAVREVNGAITRIGLPASIHGTFAGTAQAFQQSVASEP